MKKNDRQAVVIIHGMGEQRPMDTLRDFVDGVKSQMEKVDPSEKKVKVRSKADSIGDIYETVRLSMESNYQAGRPITDFYEFYWAHNMRGTKIEHMWTWLKHVFLKPLKKVPQNLHKIWWVARVGFVVACLLSIAVTFFIPIPSIFKPFIAILGGTLISFLIGLLTSVIKSTFLNSLGDVARYLTPEPDNIKERSNIRQQGIAFLKKLHSIKNATKPDRIIIVAHSLGSVVAYDLMRLLWAEYGFVYTIPPTNNKQEALEKVNQFSINQNSINDYEAFADAQQSCWKECHKLGNPWLITDFITLGAALSALDYFIINKLSVEELIERRELPVCPPLPDDKDNKIYYRGYIGEKDAERRKGVNIPHNAALFSMTRWVNIYFTSDYVGGKMGRIFGKGIKDVSIKHNSKWFLPSGHTDYWTFNENNQALAELVSALRLNREH